MIALAMMLQAGASCCLAASLAAYVAMLRRKSGPQWTLLAILMGISVWCAGVVVAWADPENASGLGLATLMVFMGSCFVPGLTLYLTARCSHVLIVEEQPVATAAAILVPGSLSYVLLLTNSQHGLFIASPGFEVFRSSASVWAGPIFWVHLLVSYAFVATALILGVTAAFRVGPSVERRRLAVLSLSSAVPLVANMIYVFGLLPISFPLTYAGLGVTGLLLVVAISRYGFIETFVPAHDVIAHLRAGIILADADGRVVSVNQAAERLLGDTADAIHGSQLSSSVGALDSSGSLSSLVLDHSGTDPFEMIVETAEGRVLKVHAGSVRSGRGAGVVQFIVLDDHTEQHHYERTRRRVERLDAIGVLVAGISHEINNPLAFVQANVGHVVRTAMAVEKELERVDSDQAEDLGDLREAASEALSGLQRIHEIVASTKQLLRDPQPNREVVDLNQVVRDALSLSTLERKPGLSLVTRLQPSSLPVQGSEVQLGQLVVNLLRNAGDAVADLVDAEILVETLRCDAHGPCPGGVELRVGDSGSGIPADLWGRVFVPFFTTKRPGEGTGLGLAICAEIVRDHGGVIDVSKSTLGGACLSVRLPPHDRQQPVEEAAESP